MTIPQLVQLFGLCFPMLRRLAGLPIPQLVQWRGLPSSRRRSLAGLPIPQLVQLILSEQTSTQSLAGLPIPQLVQSTSVRHAARACLAGLPIPQLVQLPRILVNLAHKSCRPSNSPVGTMPKPKHPLRTGGVLVWTEIKMRFGAGKVALRAPFSENRSQKKGLPANTRGADGLTLRVIA